MSPKLLDNTCKDLGLDPFAYLRDILASIASHPMKNLADLLPDNYLNPNP